MATAAPDANPESNGRTTSGQRARRPAVRALPMPPGGVRVSGSRDKANAPVGRQDVSRIPGQSSRHMARYRTSIVTPSGGVLHGSAGSWWSKITLFDGAS